MGLKSKNKGKVGEREVVAFLKKHGFEARRGQQFEGSSDSPDVVSSVPGVHLEVKRREAFALYPSLEQAEAERDQSNIPVVLHRRNRKQWVAVMYAEDWAHLMRLLRDNGIKVN